MPAPPIKLEPPITVAAITLRSMDWPSLVVTPPSRLEYAGDPGHQRGQGKDADHIYQICLTIA